MPAPATVRRSDRPHPVRVPTIGHPHRARPRGAEGSTPRVSEVAIDAFDEVPIDRITDGDITIVRLGCGHHRFYVGHTVDVDHPVLCGEPHPDHPDGHGVTRIKQVARTTTVTVTHVID